MPSLAAMYASTRCNVCLHSLQCMPPLAAMYASTHCNVRLHSLQSIPPLTAYIGSQHGYGCLHSMYVCLHPLQCMPPLAAMYASTHCIHREPARIWMPPLAATRSHFFSCCSNVYVSQGASKNMDASTRCNMRPLFFMLLKRVCIAGSWRGLLEELDVYVFMLLT